MKRAYFVHEKGEGHGLAVVSTSLKKAKLIVFNTGEIDFFDGWVDVRGHWIRNVDVEGLKEDEIIESSKGSLKRGFYSWIVDHCDSCGGMYDLSRDQIINGKCLCLSCYLEHQVIE